MIISLRKREKQDFIKNNGQLLIYIKIIWILG